MFNESIMIMQIILKMHLILIILEIMNKNKSLCVNFQGHDR